MGLLDKVESNETKAPKKQQQRLQQQGCKAVPVAAKAAKPEGEEAKVKKARPASLSSEYEIAQNSVESLAGGLISSPISQF